MESFIAFNSRDNGQKFNFPRGGGGGRGGGESKSEEVNTREYRVYFLQTSLILFIF